jgi:exonuclease III
MLKVCSLNILGVREKLLKSFILIEHLDLDILLFQETRALDSSWETLTAKTPFSPWSRPMRNKGLGLATLWRGHVEFCGVLAEEDWFAALLFRKQGKQTLVINIYLSCHPTTRIKQLEELSLFLLHIPTSSSVIIGGDWNSIRSPALDATNGLHNFQSNDSKDATLKACLLESELLREFSLLDDWRSLHPLAREFTHFSPPSHPHPASPRRLDRICSKGLRIATAQIIPNILSDHSFIFSSYHLDISDSRNFAWRCKISPALFSQMSFVAQSPLFELQRELSELSRLKRLASRDLSPPEILGRVLKVLLQRPPLLTITYLLNFLNHLYIRELTHEPPPAVHTLEDPRLVKFLTNQISALKLHAFLMANDGLTEWDKAHLAMKHIKSQKQVDISHLENLKNRVALCNETVTHFNMLYSPMPISIESRLLITNTARDMLTRYDIPLGLSNLTTITAAEIKTALENMNSSAAPGPDGLPLQAWKAISNLSPLLLQFFLSLSSTCTFPSSITDALLVMIPKAGKPPTLLANLRPISLQNIFIKIISTIVKNRLEPIMAHIGPNQYAFSPKKTILAPISQVQGWYLQEGGYLIFFDFKNAFDLVSTPLLLLFLQSLNLHASSLHCLSALLSPSNIFVKHGLEVYKHPIKQRNGLKQGDPISPCLFNFFIAILSHILLLSSFLHLLFADDLVICCKSLQELLSVCDLFTNLQKLLHFKINWDKTKILPCKGSPHVARELIPCDLVRHFSYLGIPIGEFDLQSVWEEKLLKIEKVALMLRFRYSALPGWIPYIFNIYLLSKFNHFLFFFNPPPR